VSEPHVVAIVVTYRPEPEPLRRLVAATLPQVTEMVVVHNGSESPPLPVQAGDDPRLHLVVLGENLGVARAQNEGIRWAQRRAATHFLFFDQDSEPAPDMVAQLLAADASLHEAGQPVAALGPRYLDERQNNPPPFIQVRGLRLHRQPCTHSDDIVPVDYLVSSGCLIPAVAIERVGDMNEALFIDYVDIEWGLRAAAAGLRSYGVCAAQMRHALGEQPLMVFGLPRPVRTPLRHYYLFRNALWLYRQSGLPVCWKFVDAWRLLLKFGAYALFARPRRDHWRMMTRGLWDGLRGRLGRYRAQV
jgi:rhamnosyltransferase